jgi:hypothetical protein
MPVSLIALTVAGGEAAVVGLLLLNRLDFLAGLAAVVIAMAVWLV